MRDNFAALDILFAHTIKKPAPGGFRRRAKMLLLGFPRRSPKAKIRPALQALLPRLVGLAKRADVEDLFVGWAVAVSWPATDRADSNFHFGSSHEPPAMDPIQKGRRGRFR